MIGPPPICASCAHRTRELFSTACSAFPDGIPAAILEGGFDHRQPYDGDGGTQWAQSPGAEDMLALYIAGHEDSPRRPSTRT